MTESAHRRFRGWLYRTRQRLSRALLPPRPRIVAIASANELAHEFRCGEPGTSAATAADLPRRLQAHLRTRHAPHFFVDRDGIRDALGRLDAAHPEWLGAHVARARAEVTGTFRVYATTVGIRDPADWNALPPGPGDDFLYRGRPHRFDFAPNVALAALVAPELGAGLERLIASWIAAADGVADAVAYATPSFCTYRILALSWTLAFVDAREDADADIIVALLRIILTDARELMRHLPHAARNNHLLADAFALWFAATLYPEFREADAWRVAGEAAWLEEFPRQIYPDGSSFEHSVHYHEHVLELAAAYVLLSRANGLDVPVCVTDRFANMLRFQMACACPQGAVFALGDTTEDPLFPLDTERRFGTAAWYEVYRCLIDARVPAPPAAAPARERAFWLLGGRFADSVADAARTDPLVFPDGGFFLLPDTVHDGRLLFRSGPRDDRDVLAGHLHADLLSVYLAAGGRKLLSDSGTYTYRCAATAASPAGAPWRALFSGAGSGNGLVIAGHDPFGRDAGDFPSAPAAGLRSLIADSHVVDGPGIGGVTAMIGGTSAYAGARRSVIHVDGWYWLVVDDIPALGAGTRAYLNWQLDPDAEVTFPDAASARVTVGGRSLMLSAAAPRAAAGRPAFERIDAWVSPAYGEKFAAPSLQTPVAGDGVHATLLCLDTDTRRACALTTPAGTGFHVVVMHTDDGSQQHLAGSVAGSATVADGDFAFEGSLVWIAARERGWTEIRCVGLRRLRLPTAAGTIAVDVDVDAYTGTIRLGERDAVAKPPAAALRVDIARA